MSEPENPVSPPTALQVEAVATQLNTALQQYSNKDWNYSRISLITRDLRQLPGPYVLWCDRLDLRLKDGKVALKAVTDEITWGERHSNELGMLEIASLRLNKALLDCTSDEFWDFNRPVLRLEKKEVLAQKGINITLWYEVCEVRGEEFENR